MRWHSLALLLAALLLLVSAGRAQDSVRPLVVFVEGRQLQSAAVTDRGPSGLTRLADIFRSLGVSTRYVRLDEPLPLETDVIVLVRPRRTIPSADLARLWIQVENGAHLLIALDPSGPASVNSDGQNSGLDRLLTLEYGVSLLNGFLMEPWTTPESINSLASSFSLVTADPSRHPVIEPLARYDVPLIVWAARHLRVEPFGIDSAASALVYAEPLYAETNTRIFNRNEPSPLEINIGTDYWGRLLVGAVGENSRTQTRIAVLADGEMVETGYGLATDQTTGRPLHPGNRLFAERLAAWLLGIEPAAWPSPPAGFTWIAVDGDVSDWNATIRTIGDEAGDHSLHALNIRGIRAFRNDNYLYLAVETEMPPLPDSQLEIRFDTNQDRSTDTEIVINVQTAGVWQGDNTQAIPDAAMGVGQSIEVRIPLRLIGLSRAISELCLTSSRKLAFESAPDCIDQPVTIQLASEQDPAPVRLPPGLLVVTQTADIVNVRGGPNTNFPSVDTFPSGQVFAAVGRNTAGDWIQVQNGGLTGWIVRRLLIANGDVRLLPITG
jgi:hypothetical protein